MIFIIYDNMFIKINKVKIHFVNSLYEKKKHFYQVKN